MSNGNAAPNKFRMTESSLLYAPRIEPRYPWTPFANEDLDQTIPERFEKQVRVHPDRLAIRSAERSFTYDGLNRAANRLARTIIAKRGNHNDAVALLFDHDAEALVAMLAVLKAGTFYLVLDPQFPLDRLSYMLADSGAGLIVTDNNHAPLAAELARDGLAVVDMHDIDQAMSEENPSADSSPKALAMLLYTSGSTGKPKGVMHSHRNVLAEVRNLTNAWCLSADDRWLLYTSLSFANSVRTIYGALLNGASIYPYDLKKQGFGALPDWIGQNRITIMRTLPTTFRSFMATIPAGHVFTDVRVLSIGGEPMYRHDVDAFNEHFPPSCVIAHGLGPTECFMVCLNYVAHGTRIESAKLGIGTPLPDKAALLVDDAGREVEGEGSGEIWVKSRYIALGYWRDAERTAAAFRTDPDDPEVRIYRTGDMGARAADGSFTHVGRRDFQVKIRGYRIDVSEIEVAIRSVGGVEDVVVVAQDWDGEQRLVAFFVASTTPAVEPIQLRRSIARLVPDHMIPAAIVRIDAIPKTPNGKTDRLRLSSQPRQRVQLGFGASPANTQTERDLVRIWSGILAIDELGIHDNFFELGGDSLAAARVVAQIRHEFDLDVPMKTLFQSPTVAELAHILGKRDTRAFDESIRPPNDGSGAPAIKHRDRSHTG